MVGDSFMDFSLNGRIMHCDGNKHAEMAPHGVYRCSDGDWIAIAAPGDGQWRALCTAMRRPDLAADPAFRDLVGRKANEDRLDEIISAWTRGHDAQALATELQAFGIAAAKSANSVDLVSDGHLWARHFYRPVTDAAGESRSIAGPAWRMTDEARIEAGAPRLGQHNAYVFGEIMGLSEDEQRRLADAGAIR